MNDARSSEALDNSWAPGGWRETTARQFCWFSAAIILVAAIYIQAQGWTKSMYFMAGSIVMVAAALSSKRVPMLSAAAPVVFYLAIATTLLLDSGFFAPAAPLALAIAVSLMAVFWGRYGLIAGVSLVPPVIIAAGMQIFQTDVPNFDQENIHLFFPTKENFIRAGIVSFLMISTLAVTIFFVIKRQEEIADLLRQESQDRQVAERAFREAQKAQVVAQVASGLAHNFRNALTVITSWSELLERRKGSDDFTRRGIRDMKSAASQAAGVARQIMMLGRQQDLMPEPIDISAELESHLKLMRTVLPSTVQLQQDLAPGLVLRMDKNELQQALFNLVLNARDAIDGVGTITVTTYRQDGIAVIDVNDTGHGMPQDVSRQIFEPFFSTKGEEGTGLGLATVKHAVDSVGGTIDVLSEEGQGTTFRLSFPLEGTNVYPVDAAPPRTGDEAGDGTILVVDDERLVRDVIATALRESGYSIVEAEDAASAIKALDAASIDMLVTDAVMPGGGLTELISTFADRFPGMPVMVCSGYVREEALREVDDILDVEFMQKPLDIAELRSRVWDLLLASRTVA